MAAMAAAASREQAAPVFNFQAGDVHVAGPVIHLPEMQPTFEATVEAAAAPVINFQAGDVHVAVPEQAAPVVHNEITVEPAHISQIEIVGMPDRVTTTEVVRDKRDNITTTVQTEKDA